MNIKRKDLITGVEVATGEPELHEGQAIVARIETGARPESMRLDGYLSENFEVIVISDTESLMLLKEGVAFDPGNISTLYFSFESTIGNLTDKEQFKVPVEIFSNFIKSEPVESDDTLTGTSQNDHFDAQGGDDTMIGREGDDFFVAGAGADHHDAGSGVDTVDYRFATAGVSVDLGANTASGAEAEGDTFDGVERLYGSIYHNDTLTGSDANDRLFGHGGDDVLNGAAGDDFLDGGTGADALSGGEGFDTVHYGDSDEAVTVDLGAGTGVGGDAQGDTLSGIEQVFGSFLGDVLIGSAGSDRLRGIQGDDTLSGGAGVDTLIGGEGADVLDGGEGRDVADYGNSAGAVTVDLLSGTGVGGDAQGDTLVSIEALHGSNHGDVLSGGDADETLAGRSGDDVIDGREGGDLLYGESGNDTVSGGNGDDRVYGGLGNDLVEGGNGDDLLYGDNPSTDILRVRDVLNAANTNNQINDSVVHEVVTTEGQQLRLTLDMAEVSSLYSTSAGSFDIYFNGVFVERLAPSGSTYEQYTLDLTGTGGTDVLEVRENPGQLYGLTTYIRNVQLTDVATGEAVAADDTLLGGAGSDTLYGDEGSDVLDGGTGFDSASYQSSTAAVSVDLGAGTADGGYATGDTLVSIEKLYGSAFDDTLAGNDARNFLKGGDGNDAIDGAGGHDVLYGEGGNDTINGGDGNERIYGGDGDDVAYGGAGFDRFYGDAGADAYDGGDGVDRVDYTDAATGVSVNFTTGLGAGDVAAGDTYANIEQVFASGFGDTLTGAAGEDRLYGFGGDDTITGFDGDDYLSGGDGNDTINGGSGADALLGGRGNDVIDGGDDSDVLNGHSGDDILRGGAGNDRFKGESGADSIDGGEGIDSLSYRDVTVAVTVDLTAGTASGGYAEGDTLTSIERVVGTDAGDDVLSGAAGDERLYGVDGNDTLYGADGVDYLSGGNGDDDLDGGDGDDFLLGGAGDDALRGGAGNDRFVAEGGADAYDGGEGIDELDFSAENVGVTIDLAAGIGNGGRATGDTYVSIDRVLASEHDDVLIGGTDTDRFYGNGGDDSIFGGNGGDFIVAGDGADYVEAGVDNDVVYGGNGDDVIDAGDGRDRLSGEAGNDTLTGGAGTDQFVFSIDGGDDVVTDFANNGWEKLDFSGVVGGIGELTFTDGAGSVEIGYLGNSVTLLGLSAADLDAGDFIF